MSDSTSARPDSISDFGMASIEQVTLLGDDFGNNVSSITAAGPGRSGGGMAASFRESYQVVAQNLGSFMTDAADGLTALGYAGITVAQNYRDGDAAQRDQMGGVQAAFTPGPGQPSLQGDRAAAQQAGASGGDPAAAPGSAGWIPPSVAAGQTTRDDDRTTPSPTVQSEIDELNDQLGTSESEFTPATNDEHAAEVNERADEIEDENAGRSGDSVLLAPGAPGAPGASPSPTTA
ncbi:hypothetical protein TEK04_01220 [Klenkia sp. LSe6-5]|uniref:Excreted virulence factor EspC, type VII ESX diderm n=1 Tax=Klenkia sesuvii TaxID=3103137 RepID=A0ABU8DNT6_9ACTN